jgi:hypothetical protein
MTLSNRLADPVLVASPSAVRRPGIGDLAEKRANHLGIVDFLPGHLDGDDLAAIGIDADT